MNNTFNINRFGLLIKKQWLEYGKLYLIALAIALGVLIAMYGYMYWDIVQMQDSAVRNNSLQMNFRFPLFLLFGILFLSLSANHYFAPLGEKPKAILELTLPASPLEKFLVGLFYSCFLAVLSYLLLFYLVDLVFVSKLKNMFPMATQETHIVETGEPSTNKIPLYAFEIILHSNAFRYSTFSVAALLSSIFLAGSLFFKKFQYIKTVITSMIFLGVWLTTVLVSAKYIFANKISINGYREWGSAHLQKELIVTGVQVLLTLLIFVIAYLRFKEREV